MKQPEIEPTRIAVYMHTLYNGGVERVMLNLIHGFLERGFAVELVLDFLHFSPFEALIPEGTRVVRLGAEGNRQRLPKLMSYLRSSPPAALLSATHLANEFACLARKLTGAKTRIVLSEHTTLSRDIRDSSKGRAKLLPLTTRWIYPMADAVVAVSDGVADDVCRVSGLKRERVTTVYNPIDFAGLERAAAEPLEQPWFAADEPPVIVAIGRLEVQKNFPNLLRAVKRMREQRPVRAILLGEGSQRGPLEAMVAEMGLQDAVAMPGFVANPAAYIARAGVYAMSSSWEGMPVALIEALALGVPVVSTDCPNGPREILDGGKYGTLVAMDDSEALAEALTAALEGERKEAAGEWLMKFDAGAITERYLELLGLSSM
jgi:glycosyltransferase involved in cell wall biosynthesis